MTILILDLDWMFDKSEIPNVNCMRLSSFHKQRGESVYLVGDMSDLTMQYDKLYVWAESDSIPAINYKILNDPRTLLFGKRFSLCGAKQLGSVILGCRPDYLLYDISDEKSTSYSKANFITFFTSDGKKIVKRQPWHNTKKGVKRTIITDEILWSRSPEEIIMCLSEIINEPNIMFLQPISLKCLIENESVRNMFCTLKFSKGTIFKWRNDMGQNVQDAKRIIKFLLQLKQTTKSSLGAVPFKIKVDKTWEIDVQRILDIAAVFKQNKLKCCLPIVQENDLYIYQWIQKWLETNIEVSLIEFLSFFAFAKKGVRWYEIINDKTQWGNFKIKFLIQILAQKQWKNFLPQMCVQWGNNSIDSSKINFNTIEQYANMLI